jgi:hypothetical protein
MLQFSDFLNMLVAERGAGKLADELKIDPSTICRLRSGQGGINLQTIDEIMRIGDGIILSKSEYEKEIAQREDALALVSDLWKEARAEKQAGNK